jgi:dimethylglycine dehydrogenase
LTWKGDLSTDYSLLETNLARFVRLDKPQDFPGKSVLQTATPTKRLMTLTVEAGEQDAPYMAAVFKDGKRVGEVTSAAYGYRVEAAIAMAMLNLEAATPGTALQIEVYGKLLNATVQGDAPLWDPENLRLRA